MQPNYWIIIFITVSVAKTLLVFQPPFARIEPMLLLMHKIVVLSGLICAWYGCDALVKFFMNKRWFTWLSAFSFMIYALHAPVVLYATKAIFLQTNHWYAFRLLTFILLPFSLIFLSVLFGALLRKMMPGLYSFLTGGRGL